MMDFLAMLIDNPARAKVLRAFVFNEGRALSVADALKRTGLSSRAISSEISVLEKLGVLKREGISIMLKNDPEKKVGTDKQKVAAWALDQAGAHTRALSVFVHEVSPIRHDALIKALKRGGKISAIILSGTFMGDPSRPADLIVAADTWNERLLDKVIRDLEPSVGREIRYAAFSTPEFRYRLTVQDRLIRDTLDFPHLVLMDKTRSL